MTRSEDPAVAPECVARIIGKDDVVSPILIFNLSIFQDVLLTLWMSLVVWSIYAVVPVWALAEPFTVSAFPSHFTPLALLRHLGA